MDLLMGMFGPQTPQNDAYRKVRQIILRDEEGNDHDSPYASERIITSAWEHAMRAAHDPAGVARSLPWDSLVPFSIQYPDNVVEGKYLKCLMEDSVVLWDSDCGFTGNEARKKDEESSGDEEPDHHEDLQQNVRSPSRIKKFSDESKSIASSARSVVAKLKAKSKSIVHGSKEQLQVETKSEDEKSNGDEEASEGNEEPMHGKENIEIPMDGQRLTGKQLYENHYVDRSLPGVVDPHPYDRRPTNAVAWNNSIDYDSMGDWEHFKELARAHPGDDPRDNEHFPKQNSSAMEYEEKEFCPVVTKAGSRLWSISFAAPPSEEQTSCVDMRASYPGQLTIRFDIGRNLLIYDMFEFKPTSVHEFRKMYEREEEDMCTKEEMAHVQRLLRRGTKRDFMSFSEQMIVGPMPREWTRVAYNEQLTLREGIAGIGVEHCCHLLNYVRFKKSRLMRIRFPLHGLKGARVLELGYRRPNSDLPVPKGLLDVSQLGETGELDEDPGHDTFERSGDEIENLGLLVLEFGEECGNFAKNATNGHPFASTVLWPKDWRDRVRHLIDSDWTPSSIFSRSRRHYIVGDTTEITELANFLMSQSAPLFNILSLPTDEHHKSARKLLNSLSGSTSVLELSQVPADVFSESTNEESKMPSESVPALSKLCVQALFKNSMLRVQEKKEKQFQTPDDVHDFLRRCGIYEAEEVNMCLKAGLYNGNMSVPDKFLHAEDASDWLSTPLLSEKCTAPLCGKMRSCTIEDVLYQSHCSSERGSDEGGDYGTAAKCGGMFCSGKFVAGMCQGVPRFDKMNHNHCTQCPDFGTCIGYYRNRHCSKCGYHYLPGRVCQGCKTVEERSNEGKTPEEDKPSSGCNETCFDGMFNECPKHELMYGKLKAKLIKNLRQELMVFRMMKEENTSSRLEEKVRRECPKFADELLNETFDMDLDNKSVEELYQIRECLH